jgi:hypothetical protein
VGERHGDGQNTELAKLHGDASRIVPENYPT